jgi:hypothetical protein
MHRGSLAALLLAGTAGSAAFAQDEAAGGLISATISERLEANSNYSLDDPSPGTSYFADTRLSLGYLNETATQTLGFGLSTGARALWEAEQDFEFTLASPTGATLDYANEWSNAAFDAAFDYRQRLVNYSYFEEIDLDGDLLPDDLSQLQDDTREHRTDANVGLLLGTDAPSSYELRFIGNNIDYSDLGTNRTPRYTLEGQGVWQLQLTPVLASAVLVDYLYYNADNDENTEIRRSELSAGVVYEPNEFFVLEGGLGYANRTREDTIGGVRDTTEDDSGPSLRGEVTYLGENLTLAGNALLSSAAPETRLNALVRASYALPRGRLTGRIYQRYTGTSTGGEEARITGFNVGVVRDINLVSSVGLDFGYATQVDVEGGEAEEEPDIDRTSVTATYSHALTEVVDLDLGYRYRSRDEEPESADSHAVFLQLGRTFETRP